jgi:crotonobetainyl-CoA:carnitine CoA-transferase CaiB-like acyl-CoA transferase
VFEAPAPAIGADTRALLAEAGMGAASIDALIAGKLARQHGEER